MSDSGIPETVDVPEVDIPEQADFPGEVEMSLVDHLEELRRRLLRSLVALTEGLRPAARQEQQGI